MAEAVFHHVIEYPDNHNIPLSDIAATLIAQEKLIPLVSEVLEQIYPGLMIEKTRINLDFARHGSLSESLFIAILAIYQKDLDRDVPHFLEQMTGGHIPDEYKSLVSVIFVILVYYGIKAVGKKVHGSKVSEVQALPAAIYNYGTMLNFAAEQTNTDPRTIENALESVVGSKRKGTIARAAIDMMRPAKRGGPGRITSPGVPDIPANVAAEFPDAATIADLEEGTEVETFDNAILEVRATDRDQGDRGWAGKLHAGSMSTKRLSIKLYPTVNREALATRSQARVDALIECKRLDDDTLKPLRIHVVKLIA